MFFLLAIDPGCCCAVFACSRPSPTLLLFSCSVGIAVLSCHTKQIAVVLLLLCGWVGHWGDGELFYSVLCAPPLRQNYCSIVGASTPGPARTYFFRVKNTRSKITILRSTSFFVPTKNNISLIGNSGYLCTHCGHRSAPSFFFRPDWYVSKINLPATKYTTQLNIGGEGLSSSEVVYAAFSEAGDHSPLVADSQTQATAVGIAFARRRSCMPSPGLSRE